VENAKNQPEKLSVLRVFGDLRIRFHQSVAEDSCLIPAPAGSMSRLHAASLPACFSAGRRESGEKHSPPEGR
jgi:hypothetical protein